VKTATVADIIGIMESLAPSVLAEKWDNPGLQIGDSRWPVHSVWIALDPTTAVIEAACENDIDLLITHHPLLIKPVKSIDMGTPYGKIVQKTLQHRLALFSAHTNLDAVSDGINDMLAQKLALQGLDILEHRQRPADGVTAGEGFGIGRIGILENSMDLYDFAGFVKKRMDLKNLKFAGNTDLRVKKVAVCCGSGSGLMANFLSTDAQVFVSGDLKYHDARDAQALNRGLIDVGHFASEHIMVNILSKRLEDKIKRFGYDVRIRAYELEDDPFITI
jgi:GTP cyclohydrolase I